MTFRRSGAQRAGTGRHEQRGRRRDRVRTRGRASLGTREAREPGRSGRPGQDLRGEPGCWGAPQRHPRDN